MVRHDKTGMGPPLPGGRSTPPTPSRGRPDAPRPSAASALHPVTDFTSRDASDARSRALLGRIQHRGQRHASPARLDRPARGAIEDRRDLGLAERAERVERPRCPGGRRVVTVSPPRVRIDRWRALAEERRTGGMPPVGSQREPVTSKPAAHAATSRQDDPTSDASPNAASRRNPATGADGPPRHPWRQPQHPPSRGRRWTTTSGTTRSPTHACSVSTVHVPTVSSSPDATHRNPPVSAATTPD